MGRVATGGNDGVSERELHTTATLEVQPDVGVKEVAFCVQPFEVHKDRLQLEH
jgi:hypothetical protein